MLLFSAIFFISDYLEALLLSCRYVRLADSFPIFEKFTHFLTLVVKAKLSVDLVIHAPLCLIIAARLN